MFFRPQLVWITLSLLAAGLVADLVTGLVAVVVVLAVFVQDQVLLSLPEAAIRLLWAVEVLEYLLK